MDADNALGGSFFDDCFITVMRFRLCKDIRVYCPYLFGLAEMCREIIY